MGEGGLSTQPGIRSLASPAATTRENVPEMSQQGGAQSQGWRRPGLMASLSWSALPQSKNLGQRKKV